MSTENSGGEGTDLNAHAGQDGEYDSQGATAYTG